MRCRRAVAVLLLRCVLCVHMQNNSNFYFNNNNNNECKFRHALLPNKLGCLSDFNTLTHTRAHIHTHNHGSTFWFVDFGFDGNIVDGFSLRSVCWFVGMPLDDFNKRLFASSIFSTFGRRRDAPAVSIRFVCILIDAVHCSKMAPIEFESPDENGDIDHWAQYI